MLPIGHMVSRICSTVGLTLAQWWIFIQDGGEQKQGILGNLLKIIYYSSLQISVSPQIYNTLFNNFRHKNNTVEPQLSDPLRGITISWDNRRAKTTGLNGLGRVGLRLDN